ncbi:MAG: hypothetical protein ABWY12_11205 [Burkholderiales bacterium]
MIPKGPTADRLRAAASKLREQAATATTKTVSMPMVKGVHINGAHYLTTTPPVALALADWLDAAAEVWFGSEQPLDQLRKAFPVLRVADAILGSES